MDRTLRRTGGFSLVELMIAVAILAIVVAAVMQSFLVQNKAYTVTDQVIEAQQSLRAVSWLLERDARMTGFLVPEAAAACAIDNANAPDSLWLTDADALDPDGQSRPALGAELQGSYDGNEGFHSLTVEDVVLDDTGAGTDGYYDNDGDGTGDADFAPNAGVILVDVDDPGRGVACGVVESIDGNTLRIDFRTSIAQPPDGDRVILVPAHFYEIVSDPAGAEDEPQLMRDGRVIASGVEDLQVAFFFDANRNGRVDDEHTASSEMAGEQGADPYESDAHDNRDLREIRINLVTRTRQPDRDSATGVGQVRENRVVPAVADGYRRRVHTSTVKLRNVGYRGTAT